MKKKSSFVYAVIDVPEIGFLRSLCNNEKFKEYLNKSHTEPDREDLILHFSPESIVNTEEYKDFVDSFPNSTKHLVLNESNK